MREFGDFQTPSGLAEAVLRAVYKRGGMWSRALEPTCGTGAFIRALLSLENPPREVRGIELQQAYASQAALTEKMSHAIKIHISHADLFKTNLSEMRWKEHGPLLVVGNPPWVTNAELGMLSSNNLPSKTNLKGLRGFDAKTGEANFDIAEYIWIKLIKELAWARPTIALLCKTAVARNVLKFASATHLPINDAAIYRVDAKKWFGAAVEACLFVAGVNSGQPDYSASVFDDLGASTPHSTLGLTNGTLVSNTVSYKRFSFLDGRCPFEWRQGLKHDLSAVMELRLSDRKQVNGRGAVVEVEGEYVYPLLKSSDLNANEHPTARYNVIVPQQRLGDDTADLKHRAPRLWAYLNAHATEFGKRKSSIYEGRPPFSIFGIGEYSFAPYKVAVSGMYKNIRFRVLKPVDGKPVMLDDTCYFVPCESLQKACLVSELLNHPDALSFVNSLVFKDSKRPVTKKILQRVNVLALLEHVKKDKLLEAVNRQLCAEGALAIDTPSLEAFIFPQTQAAQQIAFANA